MRSLRGGQVERRDYLRALIRKLQFERDVTTADLARATDRTRQRFERLMREGERAFLNLADVVALTERLGPELLEHVAASLGFRVVPAEAKATSAADVLAATADAAREFGEALAKAAGVIQGGITPSEAEAVRREIAEARRALDRLEATVEASRIDVIDGRRLSRR